MNWHKIIINLNTAAELKKLTNWCYENVETSQKKYWYHYLNTPSYNVSYWFVFSDSQDATAFKLRFGQYETVI